MPCLGILNVEFFSLCKCSVDFPAAFQDWTVTDPLDLFQAPVLTTESNPKVWLFSLFANATYMFQLCVTFLGL